LKERQEKQNRRLR